MKNALFPRWQLPFSVLWACILLMGGCPQKEEEGTTQEEKREQEHFQDLNGKLCYVRNQQMSEFKIVVRDLEKDAKSVYSSNAKQISMLTFSHGGSMMAGRYHRAGDDKSLIGGFDLEEDRFRILARQKEKDLLAPTFLPEDSAIAYYTKGKGRDEKTSVHIKPIPDGEPRKIPCQGDECIHPNAHPNEAKLLYVVDDTKIMERDLEQGTSEILHSVERPQTLSELEEFEGMDQKGIEKVVDTSDKNWRRIMRSRQGRSLAYPRYGPQGEQVLFLRIGRGMRFDGGALRVWEDGTVRTVRKVGEDHKITSPCWVGAKGRVIAYGHAIKKGRNEKSYRVYLHDLKEGVTAPVSKEGAFAYSPVWHR